MSTREYCDYCKKDITKEHTMYIEMRDKNTWIYEVSCDKCSKLIQKTLEKLRGGRIELQKEAP